VIDLHTHLLPGLDDGPATVDEAVAMARAAVAAGVTEVVATPHVSAHYPNDPDTIRPALDRVRAALAQEDVPLRVHGGAEIALDCLLTLAPEQLDELRLGDGRYLLVESPLGSAASDAALIIERAHELGHRVVLAHPERSRLFQTDPAQLDRLVADGALMSVTAGAFVGEFGKGAQRFATSLLGRGLVHNLVSDMHDLWRRPPGIPAPPRPAGDAAASHAARVRWLTTDVPGAILGGDPIPAGPAPPPNGSDDQRGLLGRFARAVRGA
jgi:protein-tyrosine phosphatase